MRQAEAAFRAEAERRQEAEPCRAVEGADRADRASFGAGQADPWDAAQTAGAAYLAFAAAEAEIVAEVRQEEGASSADRRPARGKPAADREAASARMDTSSAERRLEGRAAARFGVASYRGLGLRRHERGQLTLAVPERAAP